MKHFLFFFLGLFLNVCLCNFDIHFLTASIFGEGDIKDIRDANFLLKTRLIFGGDELIKAKCTWVVFLPPFLVKSPISVRGDVEEGIVMGSIEQARHIALESNCTPIFSYERSFRTVDEMAWKAFQVVHKQFSFESVATHYFFMLPQAVILSNPLAVFQSISFYRGEEAKNVYLMHLPRGDSFVGCSLNLIVLPVGTVSYGIGSEINSLCSLMAHLEIERGDLHYRRVDVPLYYRFPLELDSANGVTDSQKLEFRREEQLHGEENRKVPAVLLTVAGHNIDWYLFNSSFAKPGVAQNLYRLKDINLDCELKLSIPIVQTASSLPSGALWFSEEKETTSETLVNYTRLRDILFPTEALCSIIFGTLLPDRNKERRIKGEYQKVEEFGDQTLFSFSAVADWVISPEDFNDISPHYNNGGYKWDGKPLSYEEEKLYSQFLKDTEPNLIYHKKNSFNSSLCSIQIIAYGDRHLCDAYQNALRHHKNSAYSGNSLRSGFDDEICFGKPLVYLYTFDGAKHLTREAYYRSGSFLQMCGDISLDEFLAVFDGIFDLCNSTKCQSYFPSNDEIFASLDSVSQRDSYHTTPFLWWQVGVMVQHPPTRYVMYLDADASSCFLGYDVQIFELMGHFNILTLNQGEYSDSGGSAKYPYPRYYLSREYVSTPERYRPTLVFDSYNENIRRVLHETNQVLNQTFHQMLLGRTFVRGDQHCLRQALYYAGNYVKELMVYSENPYFCSRRFRYKKTCWLYFASDCFEKC